VSLRSTLVSLGATCAAVSAIALAGPGIAAAQCPEPGCHIPPPTPSPTISLTGTEGNSTGVTHVGSGNLQLEGGEIAGVSNDPVTFTATASGGYPVRVVAEDQRGCGPSPGSVTDTVTPFTTPWTQGSAGVSWTPNLACTPYLYSFLWFTQQQAYAQELIGTTVYTTGTIFFG